MQQAWPLRSGFTTGTCAAAAAQAAAMLLLEGRCPQRVRVSLPSGDGLELPVADCRQGEDWAEAAIQKDSGDDPDITNGVLVWTRVSRSPESGLQLEGGRGVGRVTKPGLACPVGEAAINPVPRRMILQAVREVLDRLDTGETGLRITVSIPEGEALARKTYNPRLGIVGGLSILGTSGVVEPMSERALLESIRLELRVLRATGRRDVVLTPGNYGQQFLAEHTRISLEDGVKCSNFIGEALDFGLELGFGGMLLVGHIGKLVKLAGGVMNTHSRTADCRMELLTAHAALVGGQRPLLCRLMDCVTTEDALELLHREHLLQPVMESLLPRVEYHLNARVHGEAETGALLFSNRLGLLGMTENSRRLLRRLEQERQER